MFLNVKIEDLDKLKSDKIQLEERLKFVSDERNNLKNENVRLNNDQEKRVSDSNKQIESLITLKQSAEHEKQVLNNERVSKKEKEFEEIKKPMGKT